MAELLAGRYRVVRPLGEGAMGIVLLVEDELRNRLPVALKRIHPNALDAEALEAFEQEFKVLARLQHPNVASAYDFGVLPETREKYFTSEFVAGLPLSESMQGMGLDEKLEIAVQACRGLHYIHARGLVHHDVKANNVMICPEAEPLAQATAPRSDLRDAERLLGIAAPTPRSAARRFTVKIIDFGLVQAENRSRESLVGAPAYLCPEKIRWERADRRADLYALGVILYWMFAGCLPFDGNTVPEVLEQHLKEPPRPPREIDPAIPEALEGVILRLLEKDPKKRFDSAAAVIEALNRGLARDYPFETGLARAGYAATAPLVGREAVLGMVTDALDRVLRPFRFRIEGSRVSLPPQAILLFGEHGMGRTRLLQEVRTYLLVGGSQILEAACPEDDARDPRSLRDLGAQTVAAARSLGLEIPPAVEALASPAGAEAADPAAAAAALPSLLEALAAKNPVAILLDDLQGASEATWTAIAEIARNLAVARNLAQSDPRVRVPPLFLVGTYADSAEPGSIPLEERLAAVGESGAILALGLAPLRDHEVRRLVQSTFGRTLVPESFLRKMIDLGRGNPALVEEGLQSLADSGALAQKGGFWAFTRSPDEIGSPESMADVLARRAQELSPEARRLLGALSLWNRPVPEAWLAPLGATAAALSELRRASLVAGSEETGLRVGNPRLATRLRAALKEGERRELHQAIADAISRLDPRPAPEKAAEVARHLLAAGDREAALAQGLRAAEALRSRHDYGEAIRILEEVRGQVPAGEKTIRLKIAFDLLALEEGRGDPQQAAKRIEETLLRFEGQIQPRQRTALHEALAERLLEVGKIRAALKTAEGALEEGAGGIARPPLLAAKARALVLLGSLDEAERTLAEIPPPPDPHSTDILVAEAVAFRARCMASEIAWRRGRPADAVAPLEDLAKGAAKAGRAPEEGAIRVLEGNARLDAGELAGAGAAFREALRIHAATGSPRGIAAARTGLGEAALARGQLRGALDEAREAIAAAERSKSPLAQAEANALLGRLYGALGRYDKAYRAFERAAEQAKTGGDEGLKIALEVSACVAVTALGGAAVAFPRLKTAVGAAGAAGLAAVRARAQRGASEALGDLDNLPAALGAVEQALASSRTLHLRLDEAADLERLAWIRIRTGDLPATLEAIRAGADLAGSLGSDRLSAAARILEAEGAAFCGRHEEALRLLRDVDEAASRERLVPLLYRIEFLRIPVLAAAGRPAEASACKRRLQALVEEQQRGWEEAYWPGYHDRLRQEYYRVKSLLLGPEGAGVTAG